ncbi:glycosyltransferase family 15 protein [Serendipita vermifera MAFF 305830]|uniref:Glycosyltransferase family 15 protein n=1 Tax=Serendipita vermifera MAFF 305830 TaxID=933852 RepID=A0A0C2W7J8_SERVB|nr:glycosyltransferase family 15 protein [Serendipita vermifera MAFF 305830]
MVFTLRGSSYKTRGIAFYCILVFIILVGTHVVLSTTHEQYGRMTSISRIAPWTRPVSWANGPDETRKVPPTTINQIEDHRPQEWHHPQLGQENATFVILARNYEYKDLAQTLRQLETRFNHKYHYPYTFLSDEPFSEEFKEWTSLAVSSKVQYGLIPREQWDPPSNINLTLADELGRKLQANGAIYGDRIPYKNMCRFNSGYFFRHELVQKYRYYWRVEPSVNFFCDLNFDPFTYMREHDKTYSFTISLKEFENTIPTLWNTTKEFMAEYPELIARDNAMAFLSNDGGDTYNLCHFWSNFEIADMEFWRSETYMKWFNFLDMKGGFYYERWGDAPVHSIAAALLLPRSRIHFFNEIGYKHSPFEHCPQGDVHEKGRCSCKQEHNFDNDWYSCTARFHSLFSLF